MNYKECGDLSSVNLSLIHLYLVKEYVNVKMNTVIIYVSQFTFTGLQKWQKNIFLIDCF
jgi:hypothetical protein